MIRYRPFRNSDPPAIAEIWRAQTPLRARVQDLSTTAFERLVLAKPYFDRHGLIVAVDDRRPIGFVHAGFGPNEDGSSLRTDTGVTCLLMVGAREEQDEVAAELLRRSEQYLRERGAKTLCGGAAHPLDPFYLGLYGGSRLPGILTSDQGAIQLFRSEGYKEIGTHVILQRKLAGFRPPVDRRQMQLRRQCKIVRILDPRPANWWEACMTTHMDRVHYCLKPAADGSPRGEAVFWDMEPMAANWGVHARGLFSLEVDEPHRRQGLATYLLGEAMREMRNHGVAFVEAQVKQSNNAAWELLKKLRFKEVERGIVFCKQG